MGVSDIGGLFIGMGALGVFWNLMLLMAALSMMDIFPDAKKEARTDAFWLLVCVVVIVLGSVING